MHSYFVCIRQFGRHVVAKLDRKRHSNIRRTRGRFEEWLFVLFNNKEAETVISSLKPLFGRIMKLKEKNPKLKILISTGGWGKASEFDSIARSEEARLQFSENVISFCRQWGFDGVDLGTNYKTFSSWHFYRIILRKNSSFLFSKDWYVQFNQVCIDSKELWLTLVRNFFFLGNFQVLIIKRTLVSWQKWVSKKETKFQIIYNLAKLCI